MNLLLESNVKRDLKGKTRRCSTGKYIVIDSECD